MKFKVGDRVRIKLGRSHKRGRRKTARIQHFYTDIEGGVILEQSVAGFRSWNVEDLEKVKK